MDVQVRDTFAAVRTVIDHHTKAFSKLQFFRDITGGEQEVSEEGTVFIVGFADAGDRLFGDDQNVDRSLRLNIVNHNALVILVLDIGGNLPINYFLKQGFHGGSKG